MPKLTYWVAPCLNDAKCYSIRTKTRREAKERLAHYEEGSFGKIAKVTVEYKDGFDLMDRCLTEGGAWWEDDYV